jgi:hypothetical protein
VGGVGVVWVVRDGCCCGERCVGCVLVTFCIQTYPTHVQSL